MNQKAEPTFVDKIKNAKSVTIRIHDSKSGELITSYSTDTFMLSCKIQEKDRIDVNVLHKSFEPKILLDMLNFLTAHIFNSYPELKKLVFPENQQPASPGVIDAGKNKDLLN